MMSKRSQRASFGVYVRFRRSRLPLRRGIDTLEQALAAATALRASRFHDGGDVFVVREPEGTIVELVEAAPAAGSLQSSAPPSSAPPSSAPPSSASPLSDETASIEALQEEPPGRIDSEPSHAAPDGLVEAHTRARL